MRAAPFIAADRERAQRVAVIALSARMIVAAIGVTVRRNTGAAKLERRPRSPSEPQDTK